MKNILSKSIFIGLDILMVILSLYIAFLVRNSFDLTNIHTISFQTYFNFYPLYIILLSLFLYEGIYTYRYDFWHESRIVIKVLLFSAILVFAYLAMTKSIENYSRLVIGVAFLFMAFFIPLAKNLSKKSLFRIGLWQKKAKIHGDDPFLTEEIYGNPYLGYVKAKTNEKFSTVFINSKGNDQQTLQKILDSQMKYKDEVIFIPLIGDYDLTHSHIYELSNTRTNLIIYQNRLVSWYRRLIQLMFNYFLAILSLPILLPIIGIITILIKKESSGPVFFAHNRVGQNGKIVPTYKFRSMYSDAQERLQLLLSENEILKEEWENSFKLKDDPRVTKVGKFLRKTSLDELPQIFNVLRGEMHFVGPRPVLQEELEKYYKSYAEYYLMVKPGITGLWQVSGRSDTDYEYRVKTDKWYVLNWSLWLDIVILIKTIKVVLQKDGAY
ncbi:MAG: exopolysaccharide biosynthesis polyprenyl glycosylphosphotransferase [Campylobacterota bacterium]|nr:exopolysaccharide biosynthesis polyprenyl glycosylphosphotransferase [Campylobacterota bacterium]